MPISAKDLRDVGPARHDLPDVALTVPVVAVEKTVIEVTDVLDLRSVEVCLLVLGFLTDHLKIGLKLENKCCPV